VIAVLREYFLAVPSRFHSGRRKLHDRLPGEMLTPENQFLLQASSFINLMKCNQKWLLDGPGPDTQ